MKLFLLGSLLAGTLGLLLVDLKIQKQSVVRERVIIERANKRLKERRDRIQAEIQMELANPELTAHLVNTMEFERNFDKSREMAKVIRLQQGTNDTQTANETPNTPAQP